MHASGPSMAQRWEGSGRLWGVISDCTLHDWEESVLQKVGKVKGCSGCDRA